MDGPRPVRKDTGFMSLPLDIQRTIIDWCIANQMEKMELDGKTYELPDLLQITFRCSNDKCNEVISARFFRTTVIRGGVASTRRCPKCRQKMYITHKTGVLDYYLGPKRKELEGLAKFFAPLIQREKEQYGGPGSFERDS